MILHAGAGSHHIEDKLIAAEARDRVTKEQVIYPETESNVSTTCGREGSILPGNNQQITIPHDQAIPRVKQYMMDQARNHYRRCHGLHAEEAVSGKIPRSGSHGYRNGGLSFAGSGYSGDHCQFSDFNVPFCGGFSNIETIEKNYPDKVRSVYRQFPLTIFIPLRRKRGGFPLCASDQKRFWEFHDLHVRRSMAHHGGRPERNAVDLKLNTASSTMPRFSAKVSAEAAISRNEGRQTARLPCLLQWTISFREPHADIREIIEDERQRQSSKRRRSMAPVRNSRQIGNRSIDPVASRGWLCAAASSILPKDGPEFDCGIRRRCG
jgi:hypothetical protein